MGTILFLILKLSGLINTPMDWVLLCGFVAVDSIGVPALIGLVKK